eukprot:scaffold286438_cov26-Prasinocladus_malaysianus.AAC.1
MQLELQKVGTRSAGAWAEGVPHISHTAPQGFVEGKGITATFNSRYRISAVMLVCGGDRSRFISKNGTRTSDDNIVRMFGGQSAACTCSRTGGT